MRRRLTPNLTQTRRGACLIGHQRVLRHELARVRGRADQLSCQRGAPIADFSAVAVGGDEMCAAETL